MNYLGNCSRTKGSSWRCSLYHNIPPHVVAPAEVPYSSCRQGESSWHSPHLEIRILSSLLLDFHNLRPEGLEAHHIHLGAPLGSMLALQLHVKALELHMKALVVHMRAEEGHMTAEEQSMSACCRMAYCRRVYCKRACCRTAWEQHKLVCNLHTKVFQAPPLCPYYGGFSM